MMWIAHLILLTNLVDLFKYVTAKMEPYVVGGEYAKINQFPHSAFLAIACRTSRAVENWSCGSSILNQKILLTAAHCLEDCLPSTFIGVAVGSAHKKKGITYRASKFKLHPDYDSAIVHNDIALIKVAKPLKFTIYVKRVVLMRSPPYKEPAAVAGWGLVDELRGMGTFLLKSAQQKVWNRNDCIELLETLPPGTICAGYGQKGKKRGYSAEGDSGSALVVRNYIQIGLVSYKNPAISKNLVVYTDVSYYLEWITNTSKKLHCEKN